MSIQESLHDVIPHLEPTISMARHHEILEDERKRVKKAWHTRIGYLLRNHNVPRWIEFYLRRVLNNDNIFGVDKQLFTWIMRHKPEK